MSRYRIVEQQGVFYPERKILFIWRRFRDMPRDGMTTFSSLSTGVGAFSVEDARKMLTGWIQANSQVIYSV